MKDYTEIIDALRHCAEDGFDSCENCPFGGDPESCAGLPKKAAEAIEHLSAAAVRPVVQGKWIESRTKYDNLSSLFGFKCSECGGFCIGESNYCPNCGAEMKQTEENE